jgi:hypothetical protein
MAKKINVQSQDDFESELKSEVPVFDGVAVTIVKQGERAFKIVRVTIDSKSLELGELEVIGTADTKYEAVEKFKIAVIQNKVI